MAHSVVLEEGDVVLQSDELVIAVALRVGEGILYAIKKWQGQAKMMAAGTTIQ